MGALGTLFARSIAPIIARQLEQLVRQQLGTGTPLDIAIRNVLAQLEAEIPDANVRAVVEQLLGALLNLVEGAIQSALPPAAATSAPAA